MEKIIVFDFDKTLTNYDTILPFFKHCIRNYPFKQILLPIYYLLKVLSKFKVISVKREKEIGLILFCSKDYHKFIGQCESFSRSIRLNKIYNNEFKNALLSSNTLIIASASFKDYLIYLFPDIYVVGTTLKINDRGQILGIEDHPFKKDKATLLRKHGFSRIDKFYTDSINDLPTSVISQETLWIERGELVGRPF